MFLFNEVMLGGQVISPPGFSPDRSGNENAGGLAYWMLKAPSGNPMASAGAEDHGIGTYDHTHKKAGKRPRAFMILCRVVGPIAPRIYSLLMLGDWLFVRGVLVRTNVRRVKDRVVVPAFSVNVNLMRWTAPPRKRRSITEAEYQKLKAAAIGKPNWDPYYVPPEILHDLEVHIPVTELEEKPVRRKEQK